MAADYRPQDQSGVSPTGSPTTPQPPVREMVWVMWVSNIFVLVAGFQLFVLTESTADLFAWTIRPPLTAAFLGACYWASCVVVFWSWRERTWAHARAIMPAALVFSTLTLIATLAHIDRFHVGSIFGWVWIAVYALFPMALLVAFFVQARAPGGEPPMGLLLPRWLQFMLVLQGAVMIALGSALFITPETFAPIWPWTLTPLTGRATGAWLVLWGIMAAQAAWENDAGRSRWAMLGFVALGLLQFLTLARYPGDVAAGGLSFWLYILMLLFILATGMLGWLIVYRSSSRRAVHV